MTDPKQGQILAAFLRELREQGITDPDAQEDALVKRFGEVPDEWLDPELRAQLRESSMGEEAVGGHLSNFGQAYGGEDRLGDKATVIGFERNVAGQGMPGTEGYVASQRKLTGKSTQETSSPTEGTPQGEGK